MLRIEIDTSNAAFDEDCAAELRRILAPIPELAASGLEDDGPLYDINGNRVGEWVYE